MAHKRPTSICDIWFEKIKEGDILEVKKYWKIHQKTLLSVDCVDSGGFSALHLASYKGHLHIVKRNHYGT